MTTMQENVPDKAWPALTHPISLAEVLGGLTKQQLTAIRTHLQISNLSTLNKQGLVEKLTEKLADHLWVTTSCWDMNRMKLVQKIAKNGGIWEKPLLEIQQYEYFRERGVLFQGTVEGRRVVLMPSELVELFQKGEPFKEQSIVTRNTEWIRLTSGLLYSYGTLSTAELERLLFKYADNKLGEADYINILFDAASYYENITIGEHGISDHRVENPQAIMQERVRRQDLDFCPLTKQEILKAGEREYVDRNSYFNQLARFIITYYELDREEAELIVEELVDATKNGTPLGEVVKLAMESIEMPSEAIIVQFVDLLVPLMNHTKQWMIKGYSPKELSAKRASASMLVKDTSAAEGQADVIDLQTKQKIGRNDPCPCGSGKKYKKCCG